MTGLQEIIKSFRKDKTKEAITYIKGFKPQRINYALLYRKICDVLYYLRKKGIKPGDKIAIWSENRPEWVYLLFAAIAHGVIVVPLDAKASFEFAKKISSLTKCKLFFKGITVKGTHPEIETVEIASLDLLPHGDISFDSCFVAIPDEHLCEIVFTSGTTGEPKGVMLTHKNIFANIQSINKIFTVKKDFRFLSILPLSHMFEQTIGMLLPFYAHASIVYLETLKPTALIDYIREERVTNMIVVPRVLEAISNAIKNKVKKAGKEELFNKLLRFCKNKPLFLKKIVFRKVHNSFGNFKFFVCGGAPLSESIERFFEDMGFIVVQGYGMTEAAPVITCNLPASKKIGSIGKAIPDVDIKLTEKGEIIVKGENVFSGYYENKKATEETLKEGWLYTGDIAEDDNEGFYFIKGRVKNMIVTPDGLNVYPEDIESILKAIEGVKDACVLGLEAENKKGELVHASLLLEEESTDAKSIIDKANAQLSNYQKIRSFTVYPYDDFPRTTTLKIKKSLVKETVLALLSGESIEKSKRPSDRIAELILKVVNVKVEDIKDEAVLATDLQMSSIDRIELLSLIEQELGVTIDEELVTDKSTVADIKSLIQKAEKPKPSKFRYYQMHSYMKFPRFFFQEFVIRPLLKLFIKFEIFDRENLKLINEPVIFVANHQSYLDVPALYITMPKKLSLVTAPAAWEEFFIVEDSSGISAFFRKIFYRLLYELTVFFINIFPFPQSKSARQSMVYAGKLLDNGFNILIFPEGAMTKDGEIHDFMQGIGIILKNIEAKVVPIYLDGLFEIYPKHRIIPKKGKVKIRFGKPLKIDRSKTPQEITQFVEKAVRELKVK